MATNPAKLSGKNPAPAPPPRSVRVFSPAELKLVCGELVGRGSAAVTFAAATGLRPAEWAQVERRNVDRARRILTVRGAKTKRSFREVPLTTGALRALDSLVARLDSPYVFAGPKRGAFDIHNFRRREWNPAVETSGIKRPARLYDLRSTFASSALASGITVYERARIMGTSAAVIEAHYGALLDTAHESMLERLDAGIAVGS